MQGGPQPIFSHVEPVFPVRDIPETIKYWQEVLDYGMAQYSVREINGYYVHFAGNPVERGVSSAAGRVVGDAVASVRIVADEAIRTAEKILKQENKAARRVAQNALQELKGREWK